MFLGKGFFTVGLEIDEKISFFGVFYMFFYEESFNN